MWCDVPAHGCYGRGCHGCLYGGGAGAAVCLCREGLANGEADFSFAERDDGTLKEVKGALGGARMVSSQRPEEGSSLLQRIEKVRVRKARA